MSEREPEASPAQQEAVRRLLAEARHPGSMPPDVAARLDGVLAQLGAEGPRAVDPPAPPPYAPGGPGQVVDLAARRRRRITTGLLGAAAAVVVLGVGISQVVPGVGGDDSGDAGSSAEDFDQGAEQGDPAEPNQEAAPTTVPTAPSVAPSEAPPDDLPSAVPTVARKGFAATAVRLRDAPSVASSDRVLLGDDELTSEPMFVCPPIAWGEGRLMAVTYRGNPAVLAYRPPAGDTQTVALLQCGSGDVLRSTVIPYP